MVLFPGLEVARVTRVSAVVVVLHFVEHFSRELDIVIGCRRQLDPESSMGGDGGELTELADLRVINTQNLGLLGGPDMQAGDQVQDEEDDAGEDKGIASAGEGIGKLVSELDPVTVQPAASDDLHAVQVGDVIGGKKSRTQVPDEAANGVHSEDVEGIVDPEHKLEFGAVVGKTSSKDTIRNSRPRGDVSWKLLGSPV